MSSFTIDLAVADDGTVRLRNWSTSACEMRIWDGVEPAPGYNLGDVKPPTAVAPAARFSIGAEWITLPLALKPPSSPVTIIVDIADMIRAYADHKMSGAYVAGYIATILKALPTPPETP